MARRLIGLMLASVVVAVCFLDGCSDDEDIGFKPFGGITVTDSVGNIISEDPGDWCYGGIDPNYCGYFRARPSSFSLPCSTFGDSATRPITLFNNYTYNVAYASYCADTTVTIHPDSATVPGRSEFECEFVFHLFGDSIHTGEVVFLSDSPDSQAVVAFEAGFVDSAEDYGIWPQCNVPIRTALFPAYPNPATDTTNIAYTLAERSKVTIAIYSSSATLVTRLVDQTQPAGSHRVGWNVADLPPGIYKCYMEAGKFECQGDIEVQ